MLRNILNLEGVQQLNKEQQKSLQGGARTSGSACFYKNGQCCDTSSPNGVFCEAGRCTTYGCLWY